MECSGRNVSSPDKPEEGNSFEHHKQDSQVGKQQRRRSYSVATAQPSVETVIVKAKRAAATLWTLLHAQNCIFTDRCPHTGCKEAKSLYLHIKLCPAGNEFPCPTNHKGCDDARKLLAHYKRCRSIRAHQANQSPTKTSSGQEHVCLVCSLVARQARSTLERPKATFSKKGNSMKVPSPFSVTARVAPVESDNDRDMPPPSERRSTRVRFNEGANSVATISRTTIDTIDEEPSESSEVVDLDFKIDLE